MFKTSFFRKFLKKLKKKKKEMNSRTVSFTSSIISIQFSFFFSFAQSIAHCVTEHPHRTYVTRTNDDDLPTCHLFRKLSPRSEWNRGNPGHGLPGGQSYSVRKWMVAACGRFTCKKSLGVAPSTWRILS